MTDNKADRAVATMRIHLGGAGQAVMHQGSRDPYRRGERAGHRFTRDGALGVPVWGCLIGWNVDPTLSIFLRGCMRNCRSVATSTANSST